MSGTVQAAVILRPVNLQILEQRISAPRSAANDRAREDYASWLIGQG